MHHRPYSVVRLVSSFILGHEHTSEELCGDRVMLYGTTNFWLEDEGTSPLWWDRAPPQLPNDIHKGATRAPGMVLDEVGGKQR